MARPVALFAVLFQALLPGVLPAGEASAQSPPNLILILSDDHRWDVVGVAGNDQVFTPHLDALAQEGIYYPQAIIHVSQCHPSRATLVTALPPHAHGVHSIRHQGKKGQDRESFWAGFCAGPTLPALLQKAGYATALVGKWHLYREPWECGFSEIATWLPHGGSSFVDPENLHQGRSLEPVKLKGNTQEIFTRDALDFLASRKGKKEPFFLWFSVTTPHLPYGPNPAHIQKLYQGKKAEDLLPPSFPEGDPIHEHWVEYYEGVSHTDEVVGRVLASLKENGLADNTVVIFLGDNGYMMGERGLGLSGPNGKTVPYDASLRVPLILAGTPLKAWSGRRDLSQVDSLDIPPTLLALAGVALPKEWPGRDLISALRGGKVLKESFAEFTDPTSQAMGHHPYRLIRTHEFKWIDWENPERPDELYNLKKDPWERNNLAGDPDHKAIREDLERRLHAWQQRSGDPLISYP